MTGELKKKLTEHAHTQALIDTAAAHQEGEDFMVEFELKHALRYVEGMIADNSPTIRDERQAQVIYASAYLQRVEHLLGLDGEFG